MNRLKLIKRILRTITQHNNRILAYHSISTKSFDPWTIYPDSFQKHLEILQEKGFHVIDLIELNERLNSGVSVKKTICITFDDGFKDFLEIALPKLKASHFSATVFVPVDKVGKISDWSRTAPNRIQMSWEDLYLIINNDMVVGSHSMTHPNLTEISDIQLNFEILESFIRLKEQLAIKDIPFAYPFGEYGVREQRAVEAVGYINAVGYGGLWGNEPDSDRWSLARDAMIEEISRNNFIELIYGWRDMRLLITELARKVKYPIKKVRL